MQTVNGQILRTSCDVQFLTDHSDDRTYATALCLSVTLCNVCIVAKWCILEQKLLLTAYRKSYIGKWLAPKWMTLTFAYRSFKVMSTISSHSPLNISRKLFEIKARVQRPPIGNGLWGSNIDMSVIDTSGDHERSNLWQYA